MEIVPHGPSNLGFEPATFQSELPGLPQSRESTRQSHSASVDVMIRALQVLTRCKRAHSASVDVVKRAQVLGSNKTYTQSDKDWRSRSLPNCDSSYILSIYISLI